MHRRENLLQHIPLPLCPLIIVIADKTDTHIGDGLVPVQQERAAASQIILLRIHARQISVERTDLLIAYRYLYAAHKINNIRHIPEIDNRIIVNVKLIIVLERLHQCPGSSGRICVIQLMDAVSRNIRIQITHKGSQDNLLRIAAERRDNHNV